MSFLDASADVLLDVVLTDSARMRLAKGDGSFNISKFALGDTEINYANFNKFHSSGSAYFDLTILQTPIMEAFTNNGSSGKSLLISIPRNDLLYLPIVKVNELPNENARHSSGVFVVAVNENSEDELLSVNDKRGILRGARPGGSRSGTGGGTFIRVDQGLDTNEISPSFIIDADLVETQYEIQIDNRFGTIVDINGKPARVSFIDDDNIASYFVSLGTDSQFVEENTEREASTGTETIRGPRGTILKFKIKASIDLYTSTFLFDQLGGTATINTFSVSYIDSIVRVRGSTTGRAVDIPVRFAKR